MKKTTNPEEIDFKAKFDLSGKRIVITGACGLVGRAFCEAVAQHGGIAIPVDIPAADPEKYGEQLASRHNSDIKGYSCTVDQKAEVLALKEMLEKEYGQIDGLVNAHQNKSHLKFEPFEDVSEENWDTVVKVNLKGTFLTCQVLGSWMTQTGGGSVVNMPSTYSVVAPNQNLYKGTSLGCPAAYSASKGGIDALSRYLSSYWAESNIRVNMVTPHGVWNHHEPQFEENFARFSPMQRLSYNHEVCGALIFLLSDASSYVTGDNLKVDGGWSVW